MSKVIHPADTARRPVRIAVVSTNKADYGRILPLVKEIQSRDAFALQLVLGTPVYADYLLWHLRYGNPVSIVKSLPWYLKARIKMLLGGSKALHEVDQLAYLFKRDRVPVAARIPLHIEGDQHATMLQVAGFALLGATDVFERLRPDVIVLHGDRAELLTIAAAATMLHIPIVHIEGGDVSGTIDEHIRHAISKLSHLHFPVTQKSAERLVAMGERPDRVIASGMLALDMLSPDGLTLDNSFYERVGLGAGRIDLTKPFLFVMYHPVTTHAAEAETEARCLIEAVEAVGLPLFILAPNNDSGGRAIDAVFREHALADPGSVAFYKTVPAEEFYRIMHAAAVCVGNSSSFVREAAFLGTPVVLVGDRQQNREHGANLIHTACETGPIAAAIQGQLKRGRYPRDERFGTGESAKKIVDYLVAADFKNFEFQKSFHESR